MRQRVAVVLVNSIAMGFWLPNAVRRALLNASGHSVGNARVLSGSVIRSTRLTVGDHSFINHSCFFDHGSVTIGDDVLIGPGVVFASGDHEWGDSGRRAGADVAKPISIGTGCWVGAHVTVLGGVKVAEGCVLAAGAVITRDTERDGLYGGVPARRIRDLPERGRV
jgi:maltose O-acetyltransferase